jgi:hypothetical protein
MIRFASLCLAAACAAAEPAWDWLPYAADDDRSCEIHLTAPNSWRAVEASSLTAERSGDQLILRFEPRQLPSLAVAGPEGHRLSVQLVRPGQGNGLACDGDGRLRIGADASILAVPRREAAADRRWGILRALERTKHEPCRVRLDPPAQTQSGLPLLTRQIAAAQSLALAGSGVLVVLSGDDRFAAWKHREYRQALAWLVADLAARGASHVVLVEPSCPAVDEPLLAPLRAQVRDVANAYRCSVVDATQLGAHDGWELSPGVLGTVLNPTGRQRLETLLGPWLTNRG